MAKKTTSLKVAKKASKVLRDKKEHLKLIKVLLEALYHKEKRKKNKK